MQPVSPPVAYGITEIENLTTLAYQYEQLHGQGALSVHPFFEDAMGKLRFSMKDLLPDARYIIMAAVYSPPVRVTLKTGREIRRTFLPAEYFKPGFVMESLIGDLRRSGLVSENAVVEEAGALPLKALAVGCGLAEYGRNNLAYIRGMGSFHRLYAFVTNQPKMDGQWRFPPIMDKCQGCDLCARACPSQAIALDHFLLHAGRCLTLYNEQPGEFPEWMPESGHNALMGCMRCQWVCPANRPYLLNLDHLTTLDDEDLHELFSTERSALLPERLRKKLHRNGVTEGSDEISVWVRNLNALKAADVPNEVKEPN